MQIDRIALANKNKKIKIRVGSSTFDQQYLDQNEKITEYQENKKCLKCHMIMDAGEKGICKYCTGDF